MYIGKDPVGLPQQRRYAGLAFRGAADERLDIATYVFKPRQQSAQDFHIVIAGSDRGFRAARQCVVGQHMTDIALAALYFFCYRGE